MVVTAAITAVFPAFLENIYDKIKFILNTINTVVGIDYVCIIPSTLVSLYEEINNSYD